MHVKNTNISNVGVLAAMRGPDPEVAPAFPLLGITTSTKCNGELVGRVSREMAMHTRKKGPQTPCNTWAKRLLVVNSLQSEWVRNDLTKFC